MSSIRIELNAEISRDKWESYVYNHPEGRVYHLLEWKNVLQKTFSFHFYYLFAFNENGELCGILPLCQTKSILTGNRLVSLPFSHICGPIADSANIVNKLINEAKNLCQDLKCDYMEIRMNKPNDGLELELSDSYLDYMLELSTNSEDVWKKLDKKSVRWAIKKAAKEGVTVREGTLEDLKSFNQLNQETKRNIGVPAHPFNFVYNIYSGMSKFAKLYLAEFDRKPVAGILNFSFKDTVIYGYGASDRKYLKYQPNDILVWQAIEDGCKEGYKFFDFGRTSPENQGLRQFKRHWGTEELRLHYYYYPEIRSSSLTRGTKYQLATKIWRRLPLFLSRPLSNLAFKHLD